MEQSKEEVEVDYKYNEWLVKKKNLTLMNESWKNKMPIKINIFSI